MVEMQECKHDFTIEGNVNQETKERKNGPWNSQVVFFLARRSWKASWHDDTCVSKDVPIPKMLKDQVWKGED